MLNGETGHIGNVCPDCGITLKVQVCMSNAGYYIGTMRNGMPYSRESEYYPTREVAEMNLFLQYGCECAPVACTVTLK